MVRLQLYEVLRVVKLMETESQAIVARGRGGGQNGALLSDGYSFSLER